MTDRTSPPRPARAVRCLRVLVGTLLLGVALAPGAGAAGGTGTAASPTVTAVKERGGITVGTKFDQPLFGQVVPATGEPAGFDVEIAKLVVARVFGPKVADNITFVETPSSSRETALTSGAVDLVVATYSITPERDRVVDFAGPYLTSGQSLLVRRSDSSVHKVGDLAGRKVCTVAGSTSATNLTRTAPTAVPVLLDTYSACVDQLLAGSVDAVTTDEGILLGYAARNPARLRLAGGTFTTEQYGIGIPEGDRELRRRIDAALLRSFRDGSWAKAWERTVGESGEPTPEPPTRALRKATADS